MPAKKRRGAKEVQSPMDGSPLKGTTKIEYRYIFDDSYNPVYTNGAFGGLGPQGDMTINFFHERQPIPNSQTYLLERAKDAVKLGAAVDREPKRENPVLVRFITTGVVMDEACARRLYEWLGDKLRQYDQFKKL